MPEVELPRYRSHKEVWALKIYGVYPAGENGAILTPEDTQYAQLRVSSEYVKKHNPTPGGYWVRYTDGYESFSPAKAFEDGYTLVS